MGAAILIVWWLYYHRQKQLDWSKNTRLGLATLRWLSVVILAALLLQPFVVSILSENEKPRLLVYQDVSLSVSNDDASLSNRLTDRLTSELSDKYEIKQLTFGATAVRDQAQPDSSYTDFGQVMSSVDEDHYGENIGAIVVLSDGIQTKGQNPLYASYAANAPLYAVGLGDPQVYPDFEITSVKTNRYGFLGNETEIRVQVRATKLANNAFLLQLEDEQGSVISSKELSVLGENWNREISFFVKPGKLGVNRFVLIAEPNSEEKNVLNNSVESFIEILDNRLKILILSHAPHPDVGFMKRAITVNEQYDVEVRLLKDWDQNVSAHDLFILHGIPNNANDLNVLKAIADAGKQQLVAFTSSTSVRHFNALDMGMEFRSNGRKFDAVGAVLDETFQVFKTGAPENLRRFPPLIAPFGTYAFTAEAKVHSFQQLGPVKTDKPLLGFLQKDGLKNGFIMGEGIWRWHMYEVSQGASDYWIDELIRKSVRYLAIKQKRKRLDMGIPNLISENEELVVEAFYYNESFELDNTATVDFEIGDSLRGMASYSLRPNGQSFSLGLGSMKPGEYTWKTTAEANGEKFVAEGSLRVGVNQVEFTRTVADHDLLMSWAENLNGSFFARGQEQELVDELTNLETAKTVIHSTEEWTDVVKWKWIAIVLVLLLCTEWFIRKYTGYV